MNKIRKLEFNTPKVVIVLAILICAIYFVYTITLISNSQSNGRETLLQTSASPGSKYKIEAFVTNPGATVDFSVKVYVITENEKRLIYNEYHKSEVDILWLDDDIVKINTIKINITKGEVYDWRK